MIWLNVPWPPCFKGKVIKNVAQSLEKTGSSFWEKRQMANMDIDTSINSCCHVEHQVLRTGQKWIRGISHVIVSN